MSAFQFPPQQVVKIMSWTALVNAREQFNEFPVTYPFGGPAPDYLDIGAVSKAWGGRESINAGAQPSGNQSRVFIELAPYDWVTP